MDTNSTRDISTVLCEQVVPAGATRHGLVVGIETYRDSRLNLRCARADAQAIYELMIDPECGMFPMANVRLLLDAEATKDNVWRGLASLRRSAGEHDAVWVYYAGHAAPEASHVYWLTYDADVDDLYGTGLPNDQIARVLGDIRACQVIVLLDCCHAAATAIQRNPTRAVLTQEQVLASYHGQGRITLSSSDGKEKSVELGDVGHGAFTYFLQKGLRGEADCDGDGVVTADELWTYLHHKVAEAAQKVGNRQTPVLLGQMTHNLALTLNRAATQRKKTIAAMVEGLVGLRDDQLTTDEARLCLEILRRGPQGPEEKVIHGELEELGNGKVRVPVLKLLIRAGAQPARTDTAAPGPQPVAPPRPVVVPEAIQENPRLPCPACGKMLRIQPSAAGKELPCPGCNAVLKVAADLQQVTVKVAGPPPASNVETERKSPSVSAQTLDRPAVQTPVVVPGTRPTLEKEIAVDLGGGVKLEMVLIPAGEFLMGSPDSDKDAAEDEMPQHRVRITKPFYLGKYPVTQEQWEAVMGNNPSEFKGPKNPVGQLNWDDCQQFLKKLNERFRRPHPTPFAAGEREFRLPTEAQWEYACRAGSTTRYCFGDDESGLGKYAWYRSNSDRKTHPVGTKKPNAWGLNDMHGNVWEWCADWYDNRYYGKSPGDDPTGPARGADRVVRGGCHHYDGEHCRSAYRYNHDVRGFCIYNLGLRVSLVPADK